MFNLLELPRGSEESPSSRVIAVIAVIGFLYSRSLGLPEWPRHGSPSRSAGLRFQKRPIPCDSSDFREAIYCTVRVKGWVCVMVPETAVTTSV